MKRDRFGAAARYLLTVGLLAAVSLGTGSVWLWGLTALALLLPPVSLCMNLCLRKQLRGKILLATTAAKGSACMGTVLLENRSWLPVLKMYCRVGMINDLTGEETTAELIGAMGPGREYRREFLLESACCGRVYVYIQSVKVMDYFGLFALTVPVKGAARITILPEMFSCDAVSIHAGAASDDSTVSRRGDDRTEVFQLREYQAGDDIRQIHWKLSSKLDTLLLKEPSQSVSRSLLVFWDKRDACDPERMDAMAEVTASVCQSLCDRGTAFDLCWTEKDELELRQIRDEDTLLQTIPALVTQAGSPDCPEPDLDEYGQVLYITSRPAGETAEGKITYLICTDGEAPHGNCVAFCARDYRERLERLEI